MNIVDGGGCQYPGRRGDPIKPGCAHRVGSELVGTVVAKIITPEK